MVDFNTAKYELRISKAQFDRLDILDGALDDNIDDDIFTIAEKVRNEDDVENNPKTNVIKSILNTGITNWIKPNASEATVSVSPSDYPCSTHKLYTGQIKADKYMDSNGNIDNDGPYKVISEFGEKVINYYLENGSLDGFDVQGLVPDGFDIEDINIDFVYSRSNNDNFSIKNGQKEQNKRADAIIVNILTSEGGFKVVKSRVERNINFGL